MAIKELGDKNTAAAMKWREIGEEEKQWYHQLASQIPSPAEGGYDKWHETQRILTNFQDNVSSLNLKAYMHDLWFFFFQCEWAEKMGVHLYYVLCDAKNHYVGGTPSGRNYLSLNPHIPTFHISTKPG